MIHICIFGFNLPSMLQNCISSCLLDNSIHVFNRHLSLLYVLYLKASSVIPNPQEKSLGGHLDFALSLAILNQLSILLNFTAFLCLPFLKSNFSPSSLNYFISGHFYFSEFLQKVLNCYACSPIIHSPHWQYTLHSEAERSFQKIDFTVSFTC